MMHRNRQLVPGSWSLVKEIEQTTEPGAEGWYSEHSGVCRMVEASGKECAGRGLGQSVSNELGMQNVER